ncbi:MAG: bi-domain-containing oxidoreductase [Gemmatimonadaceae bacterium]
MNRYMKQLLQRLDTGATTIADVPVPAATGPNVLVETRATIVSAGTERMLVEFGRSNLLAKARSQPDKVKQVLEKVRSDGLAATLETVRAKLGAPVPLGYCQAGVVVEVGPRAAAQFKPGDRVVTNGAHAEYVRVPMTLAAKIPDAVSFEAAAFTPLAAIGLQGIRLANPTLGETVVVYGLGLIGLLTVQLLRASGCRVIGIDHAAARLALARQFGAEVVDGSDGAPSEHVLARTGGVGADAVLLTLSAKSDEPAHQAALMSRKRGRLVLVGVTGLQLQRDDFYRKELSFAVSCSYGPGRYDPAYEEQAHDYPLPFVRWTEQRNFEAVLGLMADGRLDPPPLVSHRFDFADVGKAYDLIASPEPSLGVVLGYPDRGGAAPTAAQRTIVRPSARPNGTGVGVVGAGNYATRMLLPVMKRAGLHVRTVASGAGISGALAAEQFDAERTTTDLDAVFGDPSVESVFVLTRHDTHARLAERALRAGKHVFVEKPLALTMEELDALEAAARESSAILTAGFNRRFAPLTAELRRHLAGRAGPLAVVATINAGAIPRQHWTQDAELGGGRIVGEAVHWIDLARALVGARIEDVEVTVARDRDGRPVDDVAHMSMRFADGSTAVLHYLANGSKAFPKERIECFWDGKTAAIDNWRRLRRFGLPGPLWERARATDKGQVAEIAAWKRAVTETGVPPIPLDELFEVSRWAVRAAELARAGGGRAG